MSKKIKFELDRNGVKALLKSDEMEDICKGYADKALTRLGNGYSVSTYKGRNRTNASVMADTVEARQENAKSNSILKAVGGK